MTSSWSIFIQIWVNLQDQNVAQQWGCIQLEDFKVDKAFTSLKQVNFGRQRPWKSNCSVSCKSGDPHNI